MGPAYNNFLSTLSPDQHILSTPNKDNALEVASDTTHDHLLTDDSHNQDEPMPFVTDCS